jgi:hypothetical protein
MDFQSFFPILFHHEINKNEPKSQLNKIKKSRRGNSAKIQSSDALRKLYALFWTLAENPQNAKYASLRRKGLISITTVTETPASYTEICPETSIGSKIIFH